MKGSDFTRDHRVRRTIKQLRRDAVDKHVSDVVDGEGHQYVDIVMEGGGVLGIALLGYTYALEEVGIRFLDIGGTSVGSIGALLLAAADVKDAPKSERITVALANQDLSEFLDGDRNVRRLLNSLLEKAGEFTIAKNYLLARSQFVKNLGFSPGEAFLGWLRRTLRKYGITTMRDLRGRMAAGPSVLQHREGEPLPTELHRAELALVAAEVSTETKVCFPRMTELFWKQPDEVNPALFVRASMSVPYFFQPYRIRSIPQDDGAWERWEELAGYDGPLPKEALFVDGGIMSNFPIDLFHTHGRVPVCPTFGVKLGREDRTIQRVDTPRHLGIAMFNAARHCLDYDFLQRHPDYRHLIGYIDTGEHNWLNFELSDEAKVDLFRRGVEEADRFLRGFDWERYKTMRAEMAKTYRAGEQTEG